MTTVHGSFIDRTIQRNMLGFKQTELIDAGLKPTAPETARRLKTHNDADQLVSGQVQTDATNWTTAAYSYSANGCLTSSVSSAESVGYTYDYDNRIASVDDASSFVEYLYDASGTRVGRISGTTTNYFVVDYTDGLKRPLAETDSSGTVTRYYVWAGMRLLCHIEANGDVRYYHADELGSTLALTDGTGTVTDEFAYMPYGYATHTGSTDTPFQWLGGYGVYYDSDADLHLTLHRAYSSKLKRFISADPLGIDGGVNLYAYGNLNPVNFVDPLGLWTLQLGVSSTAGTVGGGTSGSGLAISHDEDAGLFSGWEIGSYGTAGGGGFAGSGGSVTVDLTVSRNDSIHDLSGTAITTGGSFGEGFVGGIEGNIPQNSDALDSVTFSFGLGAGPSPIEGHVFGTTTHIYQWNDGPCK